MIVDTIIKSKVIILSVSIVTNGTLFTERCKNILEKLDNYIDLSIDYHYNTELNKVMNANLKLFKKYSLNIVRLIHSRFYFGTRTLNILFGVVRAKDLNMPKINALKYPIYYYNNFYL